jgi:hypothetical protein
MGILLSRAKRFSGYRYELAGEISKNANWVQTLELVADDNTVSITGETLELTFRDPETNTAVVTLVPTVSDADTVSISATPSQLGALCEGVYVVDLTGLEASVLTPWAHGTVMVRENPSI